MFGLWKVCLAVAATAVLSLAGTANAQITVNGAGASFPAPLYAKWIEKYNINQKAAKLDYAPTGSGAGIKGITDRTILFAGSDAPMTASQEKAAPGKVLHLPTVAGPVVMIYNLPGVANLKLNGEVVADIYLGKIKNWNDGKIASLNAGTTLPNRPITVVNRSDSSGTTFIFTDYLASVSKEWDDKVGKGAAVEWPAAGSVGGAKNAGVAGAVKTTEGAIGYVESAYALTEKLAYATQINKDGKEVKASIEGVEAATAAMVKSFPADLKVSIVNAPGASSYPIAGFTYLLVYEDLSYMKDKAKAQEVVNYIHWCLTEGQKTAADLGYAKLPPEAQAKVLAMLKTVKFDGQPLLK